MTYQESIQYILEVITVNNVSLELANTILAEAESNMIGAIGILIKNNLI